MQTVLALLFALTLDSSLPPETHASILKAAEMWSATGYTLDTPVQVSVFYMPEVLACTPYGYGCVASANKLVSGEWEIRINQNESYYFGTDGRPHRTQLDFLGVVLHELGHTLGLRHSQDRLSIMFTRFQYGEPHHFRELRE